MARTNRLVGLMGTDHTSVVCSLSNLDISQGASAPILRGVEFKMWSSGTLYDGYCCTSESVCLRCLSLSEPDSSTQQSKSSPNGSFVRTSVMISVTFGYMLRLTFTPWSNGFVLGYNDGITTTLVPMYYR